jgi:glycine dehydrogenase
MERNKKCLCIFSRIFLQDTTSFSLRFFFTMNAHTFTEDQFAARHIGPDETHTQEMLASIGVQSLDALIARTIPSQIRLQAPLQLPDAMSEYQYLKHIRDVVDKNKVFTSYIGMGYYDCIVPSVLQRNIFENPGWYTQYTPYQAEIAQGRLEALLNFQTMIIDLTGMEVANASLLDEGTAAAEAMQMMYGIANKNSETRNKFFISAQCFPQTIDVLRSRASAHQFELVIGNETTVKIDETFFGALLQYPDANGAVKDVRTFIAQAHRAGVLVTVATDLLSLVLFAPPGELGADIVIGNAQRFGVPPGFGGPHAAFFATKNEYIRQMPGRIIGVSVDVHNNRALRMTLQTREQHIRREKATSNICTAQALLAIMAGMYAVYYGADGLQRIATNVHLLTVLLEKELTELGYEQLNEIFFDTLKVKVSSAENIRLLAEKSEINFRYFDNSFVGISLDETTRPADVEKIISIFAEAKGKKYFPPAREKVDAEIPLHFKRASEYLTHPVFHSYHSETAMMRYIKKLENRDLSLTHSMIPLGSCTMKLNAATELLPLTWKKISKLHPFVTPNQAEGYFEIFKELEKALCTITGLDACSLQPNSGAQGEYAGLMVIRAYLHDRKESFRNVALIPSSAHGTNPASAVMAGFKVVVVKCDESGNIDVEDLRAKAIENKNTLAALLVTYPSTHGVFEESIQEICSLIHDNGGQVYMDGANLNAQVGLTSPGTIGADVCHINLHKTFSIPHGGGGPGMGPICVAHHLAQYLPGHSVQNINREKSIPAVSSAPWGSASIVLISYAYIKMLGAQGVTNATKFAILNANYLKSKLEPYFSILYKGTNGFCAHEFILDTREFKRSANIEAEDIAKRLMDYGFHAPTVSFPVAGTLMIEPTESESKSELDRFADALIAIRGEIQEIIDGTADKQDNVLKHAPHTADEALKEIWNHAYSRKKAVYPLPFTHANKFWPSVGRINNSYGDKNILCSCPPIEEYENE